MGALGDPWAPQGTQGGQGGEEFLIVLPNTSLHEAEQVADRLRRGVADTIIPLPADGASLRVTASFGVSEIAWDEPSTEDALRRADEALYRSKHKGRNCVTIAPTAKFSASHFGRTEAAAIIG